MSGGRGTDICLTNCTHRLNAQWCTFAFRIFCSFPELVFNRSTKAVFLTQSLHAVEVATMINFLPTLFNQLLRLLTLTHSEEVALNTIK